MSDFPHSCAFTRSKRLLSRYDFDRVFKHAHFRVSSPSFVLIAYRDSSQPARVGFVIPKKQIKHAVQRNRVRRIARESFRLCEKLTGLDLVIYVKRPAQDFCNQKLREQFDQALQSAIRKSHKNKQTHQKPVKKKRGDVVRKSS